MNYESAFTDLFSLLKRYEVLPGGFLALAYKPEEIESMRHHLINSIDTLLRGLQEIGFLIGFLAQNRAQAVEHIKNTGFFISAISNLLEALVVLRADLDGMAATVEIYAGN